MQGVPNTRNIRYDETTREYVIYCKIRGDSYDLTRHKNLLQAIRERDKIIADGGFEKAVGHRLKHHGKYYYKRGNSYVVVRQINGKATNFGTYSTEAEAREIVRILWKYDWDKNKLPEKYQDKVIRKPKYYTYSKGRYQITKKIGDNIESFGYYDSPEEAQRMVDELKKVNWNIDRLSYFDRKKFVKHHKYYTYDKRCDKYVVAKQGKHFGSYSTEDEAAEIVELLKSVKWDMNKLSHEDYMKLTVNQPKNYKNYTYDKSNENYIVYKTINGKYTTFGRYDSENEAIAIVDLLKNVDWNLDQLTPDERERINKPVPKHYGYNKQNNSWRVYKQINGKYTSFGEYPTEAKAQEVVELLKKNNWNKECLA